MIVNKSLITQLEENVSDKVRFSDNNQVDIFKKGSIDFKEKYDKILHMHDTLYVPILKHNILSIGKMCLKEYYLVFQKNTSAITNEVNR